MVEFITFADNPQELSKELSEVTITYMVIVHIIKKNHCPLCPLQWTKAAACRRSKEWLL